MLEDFEIPPPRDWQKFERLCRDLYAAEWEDPDTQLNGRSGQEQHGVDVYGRPPPRSGYAGLQCKRRGSAPDNALISEKSLREEVENAKRFSPPLKSFILATTAPRDGKIQGVLRELQAEHEQNGLFSVNIHFWEDITRLLSKHAGVYAAHYSDFVLLAQRVVSSSAFQRIGTDHVAVRGLSGLGQSEVLLAEFGAQLESVRTLLSRDHASLALAEAQRLKTRIWDRSDAATRTRLSGLIGIAQMELGHTEVAVKELLTGLLEDPDSGRAMAYAALAHSLQGDGPAAAQWAHRTLKMDASNVLATQVMILCDDRPEDQLLAEAQSVLGAHPEVFSAFAQRALARGEFASALKWAESALQLDGANQAIRAIATESFVMTAAQRTETAGHLTEPEQKRIKESGDLLDSLWQQLEPGLQRSRSSWLRASTIAAQVVNDAAALDRSCRLLALSPGEREFVRIRVGALVAHEKFEDARALLESNDDLEAQDSGLLGLIQARLGDVPRAAETWKGVLQVQDLPNEFRADVERNYVIALLNLGQADQASSFVNQLLSSHPDDAARLLNAARVAENAGDSNKIASLLDHAEQIDANKSPALWTLRLADLLARHERLDAAASLYESVLDQTEDSEHMRRYVDTLVSAERFNAALDVVRRLAPNVRYYFEVECSIHERLGNISQVISICEQRLVLHPQDTGVRLRLAVQHFRQGHQELARQVLATVSDEWPAGQSAHASLHARLLRALGANSAALEVLFKSRARNPDDSHAHLTFLTQYIDLKSKESPEQVDVETAALIEGVGAPGWILITESRQESLEGKAYTPDHPLARALIGKREGDALSFEGSRNVWTIKDVATKYAFAFLESARLFPSRFPTTGGFWHERSDESANEMQMREQVKAMLAPGQSRLEHVKTLYAEGKACVGMVAELLRCPVHQALGTVLDAPGGLQAFTNTREEHTQAAALLSASRPVLVVDPTALLILDRLRLLRGPIVAHCDLIVAQSMLDDLQQLAADWSHKRTEGVMSVGLDDGKLIKYEITPAEAQQTADSFGGLASWLRDNCLIRGVSPEIAENARMKADPRSAVGDSFWDAALIAKEVGLLLSDDLRFRSLVRTSLGASSLCSVTLATVLLARNSITQAEYAEAIAGLHRMGYQALPTSASILMAAARLDDWAPGAHFLSATRPLEGPRTDENSALRVSVSFTRDLLLQPTFGQSRQVLVFALLDALIAGRHAPAVIKRFRLAVSHGLRLLPIQTNEVLELLSLWQLQRSLRI